MAYKPKLLTLAESGTGDALIASNGGIFYSTSTVGAILAATATAGQHLQSGASGAPSWTTATFPSTTTINQLLYSSSANVISGLSTANNASLVTNSSGVPSWQVVVPGVFGDGSDGQVTFDGSTTILGLVPVANVYTLVQDIFLGSSTINNGVTIITGGLRIFCNGVLTNNGTIKRNGNNGTAAGVAGAAVTGGSITNGTAGAAEGTAGGAGNVGAGSNGVNSTAVTIGGSGGNGGAGGSAGGNAGTAVALNLFQGNIRSIPTAVLGMLITGAGAIIKIQGGTGGGGGGGDATVKGGGGGSGGGILIIAAFMFAGTGAIQARGGDGGSPASGTNCGGGGAGGGGVVIVISRSVISGAISGQTIDANHGTPGNPQGTGVIGGSGNNGIVVYLSS